MSDFLLPGSIIAGFGSTLQVNSILFPKAVAPIYISINKIQKAPFSPYPCQLLALADFSNFANMVGVTLSFSLHFPSN